MSYKEMWNGFAAKERCEQSSSRDSMGRIEIDRTIHAKDWTEGYRKGIEESQQRIKELEEAKKMSVAIYLELPEPVADDVANKVRWLISKVKEQDQEITGLREQDKQMEIALLATRQQRDDEFNRAEKLKAKRLKLIWVLEDILDAFWDMSPLEYAQSRGLKSLSDEEGERIKTKARAVLAEARGEQG